MGRDQRKALATEATDAPRSIQSKALARAASGAGESPATNRSERLCSEVKKGAKGRKSPRNSRAKCKAPPPETPPDTPSYSRPWFAGLLEDALSTNDVLGACKRAGVRLVDLMRARAADPAIDVAMIEVDVLGRRLAMNSIVTAASLGDLRAVKALTDGTLALLSEGLPSPGREVLAGQTHHDCASCGKRFLVIAYAETGGGLKFLRVVSASRTRTHVNENPETFRGDPHKGKARP